MSNIFVSYHMIVREDDENLKLVLDSIQGLYDELVVGVDSRPESDNVYELIQSYPNTVAFRQEWPGRFDLARQDVLNRINPSANFVGCCDSDEVLFSPSPVEIRKFLYESQPKAVNLAIRYLYDIGPNFKGASYLRTKIWNTEYPRQWIGSIHEYPACKDEYFPPTPTPHIVFEHLKVDHKSYRSEIIIEAMLKDIANGLIRWYPYLAQEYRAIGNSEEAIKCCLNYIINKEAEDQHLKVAIEEYLFNLQITTSTKWEPFMASMFSLFNEHPFLKDRAVICEYLAMACFYTNQPTLAKEWHRKAINFFTETKEQQFIVNNNKFYV